MNSIYVKYTYENEVPEGLVEAVMSLFDDFSGDKNNPGMVRWDTGPLTKEQLNKIQSEVMWAMAQGIRFAKNPDLPDGILEQKLGAQVAETMKGIYTILQEDVPDNV